MIVQSTLGYCYMQVIGLDIFHLLAREAGSVKLLMIIATTGGIAMEGM